MLIACVRYTSKLIPIDIFKLELITIKITSYAHLFYVMVLNLGRCLASFRKENDLL